jgi:branched-chain amino acid transport system permease protein
VRAKRDIVPLLLVPVLMLAALPLVGSPASWLTLTVAGLAMGLMIFVMASGLTLTFGLMDVLNFGHGAFIAVGAFVAASVMLSLTAWMGSDSLWLNLAAVAPAILAAMLVAGVLGWGFERVIVKPVYGQHLKQILVTMGGLIVAEQLLKVVWGPDQITLARPPALRGAFVLGDVAIEKYRLLAVVVGLVVFAGMQLALNRTRIGLLVRAGVENGEMVEALGYRIRRVFIGVFVVGSALAGLGGALWALYQETVTAAIGAQVMVLIFIVIIIGGLGSVGGCFVGALLVGLVANYVGFLAPKVALGSNILLMALILLWRPQGLFPVARR